MSSTEDLTVRMEGLDPSLSLAVHCLIFRADGRAAVMRYFFFIKCQPLRLSAPKTTRCSEARLNSLNGADELRALVSHFTTTVAATCHRLRTHTYTLSIPARSPDASICAAKNRNLGTKDVERRRGIDDIMSVGGRCSSVSRVNRCSSGLDLQSWSI